MAVRVGRLFLVQKTKICCDVGDMGEIFVRLLSSCGFACADASDASEAVGALVYGVSCDFPV